MVTRLKLITKNANKSSFNNDNITIDAKHSEMINYFKNQQESIPILKEELKKIILEYNNKDLSRKNDLDYILYRDKLRENIDEIKNKINTISNNDEINKYYLDVGILLHGYYENIENSKTVENNSEKFEENLLNYDNLEQDNEDTMSDDESDKGKEFENNKSVINFFKDRENKVEIDESIETDESNKRNTNEGVYTSLKISDFVKEESIFKKKNILDEYLQKIDPNYIARIKVDMNIFKCPTCSTEMTLHPSDGIQICDSCGMQQNILIESDKPSFKDPPLEVCYFSYKRINHFNEFIGINGKKFINESNELINLLKTLKKMIFNNFNYLVF
jgi:hypothetical protein